MARFVRRLQDISVDYYSFAGPNNTAAHSFLIRQLALHTTQLRQIPNIPASRRAGETLRSLSSCSYERMCFRMTMRSVLTLLTVAIFSSISLASAHSAGPPPLEDYMNSAGITAGNFVADYCVREHDTSERPSRRSSVRVPWQSFFLCSWLRARRRRRSSRKDGASFKVRGGRGTPPITAR